MKKLSHLFLMLLLSLGPVKIYAQTTLTQGDIAIIGVNTDGDDEFSFLLLKDITAGTSIYITDKGWNDGSGFYTALGDGIWQWSTSSNLSAGTIVHIKTTNNGILEAGSLAATPGTVLWVENNSTVLSYTGDQVFLYQGTLPSPTIITGCSWNVETSSTTANWDGSSSSAMTSALPDQLTNGVNAIWLYESGPTEKDNFKYNCSTTSGSAEVLRNAINNLSNWDVDESNTTPYTINPFPCNFTVLASCASPDIPTLSADPSSVCHGDMSTITINGDLNDATQWSIYTGSCGGTLSGSTATSSFDVSPSSTTTYYIRGEGGCVTPGSCATITISVNPTYNLSETDMVCMGDSYTFPDGTTQNNITSQVVHTSNLLTTRLCDSIIVTTVDVNPIFKNTGNETICNGDSVEWRGNWYKTASVYTESYTSVITGCDSIYELELTVNPSPQIYTVTGGGSYPSEGTGVRIGLSNSETGVDYTLMLNETVSVSTISGTGSAIDFGNQTTVGNYTVTAKNLLTDCEVEMDGSAKVTIATSTVKIPENNILIFPNPTNGIITIEGGNIVSVTVTDLSGKMILSKSINDNKAEIDLSRYLKAVYFVKVVTDKGIQVKKIIVE